MTLDELTATNRVLRDQQLTLEGFMNDLKTQIQRNEAQITKQLEAMHHAEDSFIEDCEICMGKCR